MTIPPDKQLLHLTVAEYKELHKEISEQKEYVYGLKGLAKMLGCSRATASKIKSSGIIDDAISQVGNVIVIDKFKALELISTKEN